MRFQILSHAGMRVQVDGFELLFDPWLLGSCYWRSWWNYPPVSRELLDELAPDAIYLTHVHWDHFHGPSLKRFARTTPIYVPKGHHSRIRRDLNQMGFSDVRELDHGETVTLAPGLALTSYQFFPFLDSAAVVQADGVTLLNANDAKFMGGPLDQILARHSPIDVVFRSHSSANGRLCFDVIDDPDRPLDDEDAYVRSFLAFVRKTGARIAVPFASNHCFLHPDVWPLNHTVTTPDKVVQAAKATGLPAHVQIMASGDAWSSETGFDCQPDVQAWFDERPQRLEAYRDANQAKLDAFVAKEARARVSLGFVQRWATTFSAALPRPARWAFRGVPVTFVLTAGDRTSIYEVDLFAGTATERDAVDPAKPVCEVHTTAFIFKQCVALDLFSHLPISKRVRFRVTKATLSRMKLLTFLWELYDYDYLPLADIDWPRMVRTWSLRWREVDLYRQIATDLAMRRGFDQTRYL